MEEIETPTFAEVNRANSLPREIRTNFGSLRCYVFAKVHGGSSPKMPVDFGAF
jgi:hypothetical protein